MQSLRIPASALLLALLTACSLAPTYERPTVEEPKAFKEATSPNGEVLQWQAAQPAEAVPRGEWWRAFKDPALDALEAEALHANQDLKAASARLAQARTVLRTAQADQMPQVGAVFGPSRGKPSPASQGLPANADTPISTLWRAQIGVAYEVDLFGRVASSVDAATASVQQSEALFQSFLLALQADVAHAYFLLRELDAENALYASTVELRAHTLKLVQRRFDEGEISELDLARARTELASAQSEALGISRRRAAAEHALAILLGKPPADFAFAASPITRVQLAVPTGLPSTLLQRRPDVAAAERALAASNARIGEARAAFFPSFVLSASGGYEAAKLSDLLEWGSRTFLVGPAVGAVLALPLFDGGRRQANLDRSKAAYEENVAHYRQTVLTAFGEVEDNLANLRILADQNRVQDEAVAAAARAAQLSRAQYREGAVSYLDVMDADRSVLIQQRVAVQLDGERARATVNLIRAIGGDWSPAEAPLAQEARGTRVALH